MRRFFALVFVSAGLMTVAACDSTPTTPTPTGTPSTSATQVFSGSIVPGDTPIYTFSVPATQSLHVMFGSLTSPNGTALGSTVKMMLGIQNANMGCDALSTVTTTAALRAQINVIAGSGAYCIQLTDTTGVSGPANFSVRLIYGTPSSTETAGTITYDSFVAPAGFTTRTFTAAAAGNVSVILDSFSPASVSTLGLGLGFPRQDGGGCEVAATALASRGTQLSLPVDLGIYCVRVFDPGTLTQPANFSLRIIHP